MGFKRGFNVRCSPGKYMKIILLHWFGKYDAYNDKSVRLN